MGERERPISEEVIRLGRQPVRVAQWLGPHAESRHDHRGCIWTADAFKMNLGGQADTRGRALAAVRTLMRDHREIPTLRPLHGLVVVRQLPQETLKMMGCTAVNVGRSPGWYVAEVLVPGDHPGLDEGDTVLVQAMSAPDGAVIEGAEHYGFEPGAMVFVPCRVLRSPLRDDELVYRRALMMDAEKKHPPEDEWWNTPEGQGAHVQLASHLEQVRGILAERRTQGRSRLMKPVQDVARADGILALIEE